MTFHLHLLMQAAEALEDTPSSTVEKKDSSFYGQTRPPADNAFQA